MKYYIAGISYSDELYHHGIIGQKWYHRRFQNEDGTLTDAGYQRYYGRSRKERKGESGSLNGGNKYYTNKDYKEMSKTDSHLENIDFSKVDHGEKGSKSPAVQFAALVLLDAVTLNPIGMAHDIARGAMYVNGKIKANKYEKERKDLEIDSATGFKKKEREYTPEEDLKRVNPDLYDFNTNSKNNCMLCTMTYEMRRRGFDVTAKKSGNGYFDAEITRWMPDAKIERYGGYGKTTVLESITNSKAKAFAQDTVSKILKSQPDGARGNLTVRFTLGGGHSMFYEIKNGQMIIRDGQVSKTYTNPIKILKDCSDINVCRFDNLKFDPDAIKECCK